jgi:hypothetical protein
MIYDAMTAFAGSVRRSGPWKIDLLRDREIWYLAAREADVL